MSDLAPTTGGGAAARTDGDNRYKAVQQKLKTLGTAMDLAGNELEQLLRRMRLNAQRTEGLAVDIANAELDRKFIEMTNQVAVAWAAPPPRSRSSTRQPRRCPAWPRTRGVRTRGCTRAWTPSAPAAGSAPRSRASSPTDPRHRRNP